jgi:formylmethanofuran dehydrogenase subunit E
MRHFIFILILSLLGPTTFGQKRFGYIDYNKTVVTFPEFEYGQEEIKKKTNQLDDSLKLLVEAFQLLLKGCYPQSILTDSIYRKELEDNVNERQKKIREFQENSHVVLINMQERMDAELKEIIVKELKVFSVENDVICMTDKSDMFDCVDCKDFTDDFINFCKKKNR